MDREREELTRLFTLTPTQRREYSLVLLAGGGAGRCLLAARCNAIDGKPLTARGLSGELILEGFLQALFGGVHVRAIDIDQISC